SGVLSNRRVAGIPSAAPAAVAFFTLACLISASGPAEAQTKSGYVDASECAACHRTISESYRRTGMGQSFHRPAGAVEDYTKNNTFYHEPSDSYFTMLLRDGKYSQRRYQLDAQGRPVNVMEKQIDYVLGSGDHARAYL